MEKGQKRRKGWWLESWWTCVWFLHRLPCAPSCHFPCSSDPSSKRREHTSARCCECKTGWCTPTAVNHVNRPGRREQYLFLQNRIKHKYCTGWGSWGGETDQTGMGRFLPGMRFLFRTELVCYCFLLSQPAFEAGRQGKWHAIHNTVPDPDFPNLPLITLLNFLRLYILNSSSATKSIYRWFSTSLPFSSNCIAAGLVKCCGHYLY